MSAWVLAIAANAEHTSNSTDSTTASVMINNGSVALDHAVHGQVASIPCIRDLSILKGLDRSLDGVNGCAAILHDQHGKLCGTAYVSVSRAYARRILSLLIASFKVNLLVLMTVVAGARVHVDTAYIVARRTTRGFACERVQWVSAVGSRTLVRGVRHALGCGEALSNVAQ